MKKNYFLFFLCVFYTSICFAQNTWPFYEKQSFKLQCFNEMKAYPTIRSNYDPNMLQSVCDCIANTWESKYDWQTFVSVSTPPLSSEVKELFFSTSYECAKIVLQRYKV